MTRHVPAEVFPPGEFIREELEARGWTQETFAAILKRPLSAINEIIVGKKAITPETAKELGDAFQTGPEFWLNLESSYRLALAEPSDKDVARRAALYEAVPVTEIVKRGWVEWSDDTDILEQSVLRFFDVDKIDDINQMRVAARKSTSYDATTPFDLAWYNRARQLSLCVTAKRFKVEVAKEALPELQSLTNSEHQVRHVPKILAEMGIRLVIVEKLPKSKIDGAAFWLNDVSPVIAISFRYDRIDCFWFTLAHELAHILHNDRPPIDARLVGKDRQPTDEKPAIEQEADAFAAQYLVSQDELDSFMLRVRPLYSKVRIIQFANKLAIHPGIIVGQLQHRREIGWYHSREMLIAVRDLLSPSAMTDGWGSIPI